MSVRASLQFQIVMNALHAPANRNILAASRPRRWALLFGVIGIACMAMSGCSGEKKTGRAYRHVLLLTVDTLRPDYLGIHGYPLPSSPTIDSLLADGTDFTGAVTPIPRTTQALGSMLTGCYPHTTMIRTLYDSLSADVVSVAEIAQENGYATIAVVSNHVLPPKRRLDRGFDVYDYADDTRDADGTTRAAIERLAALAPEDSIFLWVHYIDPHVPYYPPRELAAAFDPSYEGRYRDHFGDVPGGMGDHAYPADLGKVAAVFENTLPDRVNEHIRRLYAADIRFTDDAIAALLRWLRDNLGNDWLVIFASDHGESLGEHQYYFDHGDYVYNASLRVPLGFIFPANDRFAGSRAVADWVSLVDVTPTLLELLGLETPPDLPYRIEGRSLVPLFRGERLQPRPCFAECGRSFFPQQVKRRMHFSIAGRFRSVILDGWKLIWTPGRATMAYELYDLKADPHETVNLIDQHPEIALELAELVTRWTVSAGQSEDQTIPEDDLERLRSLGYIQ